MSYPSNQNAPPKGEALNPRELALMKAVRSALDQEMGELRSLIEAQAKEIADLRLALANQRGDMLAAMLASARQPTGDIRHDA